ncbi:Hif prolyl hydroxylase [Favolaschia claudopus]|uniref:Hif prolyl hydroxylase n=1 Tax=Favolaschia claudopus TaxID=2862362 RepID=A0AAW0CFG4_9AGAR
MSHPSLIRPCSVCSRVTSTWCSRCQKVWYCSREHMRSVRVTVVSTSTDSRIIQDWPQHRLRCRSACDESVSPMITIPPPSAPEYMSVSAILFPVHEAQPEFITVECRLPQHPSHDQCPVPMLRDYFDVPPDNIILTQGLNGETIRYPLHVFCSPTALSVATPKNRAIDHITADQACKPFSGNVVALKFRGTYLLTYTDAIKSDLVHLSAYFHSFR